MLDDLQKQGLIFVTGKGGVGKSTCTGALGRALNRRGSRVLLVETDAYSAMSELLGASGTDGDRIEISSGFVAVNLKHEECLRNTLKRYVPSARVVKALTSNRVTQAFFGSAPSVNEFVLLDQIFTILRDEKDAFDHIVVDLPASGHAVSFLGVPRTLNAMMRDVGPIARRAAEIAEVIEDEEDTGIVAVCLPEEMPVNETIELSENIESGFGRSLNLVMANMVHPRPFPSRHDVRFVEVSTRMGVHASPAGVLADQSAEASARVVAGSDIALRWFKRDRRYLDILHDRLSSSAEVVELPMVYDVDERAIVEVLSDAILGEVTGE